MKQINNTNFNTDVKKYQATHKVNNYARNAIITDSNYS